MRSLQGSGGTNMTQKKDNAKSPDWKEVFGSGPDGLRALVQQVVQEVLRQKWTKRWVPRKTSAPQNDWGTRAVYYTRTLVTRVGKLALRVLQDPSCAAYR